MKHETFMLLAQAFPAASDEAQRRLIAYSMNVPGFEADAVDPEEGGVTDYERYNLAVWLRRMAPSSAAATEHFEELQARHPEFGPREHPDLDRRVRVGFRGPLSPVTVEELLAKPPADAATFLGQFRPEEMAFERADRMGLLEILRRAVSGHFEWAIAVALELARTGRWEPDIWTALLTAWGGAGLEHAAWNAVVDLLEAHAEIGLAAPMSVASFLDDGIQRAELEPEDVERLERVGERVLTASEGEREALDVHESGDWLTRAINHPAGEVALMWVRALSHRMERAGDAWTGIPDVPRQRLDTLLDGGGNNAAMARVAFASQLRFLWHADREWTETRIVPLFDWEADRRRAVQVWDGFLTWEQWDEALFKRMEPFVRQTFLHLDDLGADAEAFASALGSVAAFSPADPWRDGGWLFDLMRMVAPAHRARWAEGFGRHADSLSAEGRNDLWDRWVSACWDDRLTGLPQPLDDAERREMVAWVIPFRDRARDVVERILRDPPEAVDHFTFHRLEESDLAASHGAEVGCLLRGLLTAVRRVEFDTGEVLSLAMTALDGAAAPEDLLAVANEMARLGLAGADDLHARLVQGP